MFKKAIKFVLISIIIVAVGWYSGILKTHYSSGGSYVVAKKTSDQRGYTIDVERPSEATTTRVETFLVKDVNTWNLIEEGRAYSIGCTWVYGDMPSLNQIKTDDAYLKDFKARFKN